MEHVHSDGSDQLKANVREIYLELSHCYHGPEDRIFLFGFSRGAFTVRVLAGLLFRCGLATWESTHGAAFFDEAWQLYQAHFTDYEAVRKICETYNQRDAHVAFLGLWDTVQSYGGLIQIALPHVRHNPSAGIVRHALALDEGRSWFKVTPWGRPDINPDDPRYAYQIVMEIWFRGAHSDVGGSGM